MKLAAGTGQLWEMLPSVGTNTGSTNDLKCPDRNLLPILSEKVPKQHCSKIVAPCIISIKVNILQKIHGEDFDFISV